MKPKRNMRVFTCITSGFLILLSSPLLWIALTTKYPRAVRDAIKPMYFPAAALAFIIVACLILFAYNLFMIAKEKRLRILAGVTLEKFTFISPKALITIVGTVIYALLWNVLGFSISSMLFMACISKVIEPERPLKQIIPVSIISSLCIYLLFTFVFRVPFPEPIVNGVIDKVFYQ